MAEADLGKEALTRLCELLGVEAEWKAHQNGFQWNLWGASQRAWSEPASGNGGWPTWRLQLRTRALEAFNGSEAQVEVLTAESMGPVGGVVRAAGEPTRLELASSLDVRGSSVGCVLWLLAVAARAHAAEVRRLAQSQGLRAAGLASGAKLDAEAPASLPPGGLLLPAAQPVEGGFHAGPEMPECVEVLKNQARARAVQSPRGLIAALPLGGEAERARSLLEVTTDARHPLLGRGLSAVIRTPVRGLVPFALAQNEREVGPWGRGDALGGWWANASGLVYASFYPAAFHPKGLRVEVVLACARRARDLDDAVAGRGPSHEGQDPTSRAVRRWLGSF